MSNVTTLPVKGIDASGSTRPVDPQNVITSALDEDLAEVIIIGVKRDGTEFLAASESDAAQVIYHCERAKHRLMRIIDEN